MLYDDDRTVGEVTRYLVDQGARVFQIFQRGTESEHVSYLLEKFDPPSGVVLDVGCGIGEVARLMHEARQDLEFVLLNRSQAQLDLCPDFEKLHADAHAIPMPDASVDAVMACYVMGHLDKDRALSEMRRVLKPGGVLFIADMSGGAIPDLDYVAHDWDGETPVGMNTDAFDRLMPDFAQRYPQIRPVIVREVMP